MQELMNAVDTLVELYSGDLVVSSSRLVNPLLDIWEMAHRISDELATPVQAMLTICVSRDLIARSELVQLADDLRSAGAVSV